MWQLYGLVRDTRQNGGGLWSPLHTLADYLPNHGAALALRAAATDGTGVAQFAAWLLVGTLVPLLVTDRRRYLSTRSVRLRGTQLLVTTRLVRWTHLQVPQVTEALLAHVLTYL